MNILKQIGERQRTGPVWQEKVKAFDKSLLVVLGTRIVFVDADCYNHNRGSFGLRIQSGQTDRRNSFAAVV